MRLILASTSPYRKALLERLGLPFITVAPNIDEAPLPGESPEVMVERLARQKALAVAENHPDSLIIGSDQAAVLHEHVLGKPGNHQRALEQLRLVSGQHVTFLTGLCLLNSTTRQMQSEVVPFTVQFRQLRDEQIERYLRKEQPYNCAGSFKSEGLGIALFERMEGEDPSALIGLPLIRLVRMLEREGVHVI